MFQVTIYCLFILGLVLVWMKTFRRPLDPRIPVLNIPYWSIFGGISYFHSIFVQNRQASLNLNVGILQAVAGFSLIFQKDYLYCIWLAFHPILVLNKVQAVEELLSSKTIVDKAWFYKMTNSLLGNGLVTSPQSIWQKRRKCLNNSFHFDILKDFQLIFDKQAKILVDILKSECDKDWVDINHFILSCTLDIISESTLGVKTGAQMNKNEEFVQCLLRAQQSFLLRLFHPLYWIDFIYKLLPHGRQFYKDVKSCREFSRKVLKERKSAMIEENRTAGKVAINDTKESVRSTGFRVRKRKALLDLLLEIHLSNQELSEEDIMDEISTFAGAGNETTAVGVCWTLYLLGLHPDIQAKVHEELDQIFGDDTDRKVTMDDLNRMEYFECVLKETLRLYPSIPMFGREIQEDREFCGYHIKKGTTLAVLPYVLHRDPNVFPNPEKFDPSRFFPENCIGRHPYAYIPFSAGPRNCIGQRFAMLEGKTIAAHILRNFKLQSLEPRDRVFPSAEVTLQSCFPLKIKLNKRIF